MPRRMHSLDWAQTILASSGCIGRFMMNTVSVGMTTYNMEKSFWNLYSGIDFVLDLATNGEMQTRISRMGSLSTRCTQYYAAQIVDAVDYMHSKGVIHRWVICSMSNVCGYSSLFPSDLKPENLLLDSEFRIKITDFGTGKILEPGSGYFAGNHKPN